jgi:uncharacterized protein
MKDNLKRIIIAGGSGFLGRLLTAHFLNHNWDVVILGRALPPPGLAGRHCAWDARTPNGAWAEELDGADVVINLTGKSVNCRYTRRNRQQILDSRVCSTGVIGEAINRCSKPPTLWLNASTATIYRHTFDAPWDENGITAGTPEAKDLFSVEVAKAWEKAFREASTPSTRKVALRLAMVLGCGSNSVFPVLRRLVRTGLGGRMGSGRQFVSWIHQKDFCAAIDWLITHQELEGIVNLSAPDAVTNQDMMRLLQNVCGVPFGLPASRWMLEAGAFLLRTETELIIKSRRVVPRSLLESGFTFQFPDIKQAFNDLAAVSRQSCNSRPSA